jgi:hypothetical protein
MMKNTMRRRYLALLTAAFFGLAVSAAGAQQNEKPNPDAAVADPAAAAAISAQQAASDPVAAAQAHKDPGPPSSVPSLDDGYSMPPEAKTYTQEELDVRVESEKDACRARLEERDKAIAEAHDQQKALVRDAANTKSRVEICSKDPSLADRIVCYDEIARDYGFKTLRDIENQEIKMGEFGFWQVTRRKNDMGDEVIYLKLDSVEPVVSRAGIKRNPTFNVRCAAKKTDVYLDWKAPMGAYRVSVKDMNIIYKIDSNRLTNQPWSISQDNHAAFSPDPIGFVKQLVDHEKLVLIVTPYADRSATLVFPLKGMSSALQILVKHCYNSDNGADAAISVPSQPPANPAGPQSAPQ